MQIKTMQEFFRSRHVNIKGQKSSWNVLEKKANKNKSSFKMCLSDLETYFSSSGSRSSVEDTN